MHWDVFTGGQGFKFKIQVLRNFFRLGTKSIRTCKFAPVPVLPEILQDKPGFSFLASVI